MEKGSEKSAVETEVSETPAGAGNPGEVDAGCATDHEQEGGDAQRDGARPAAEDAGQPPAGAGGSGRVGAGCATNRCGGRRAKPAGRPNDAAYGDREASIDGLLDEASYLDGRDRRGARRIVARGVKMGLIPSEMSMLHYELSDSTGFNVSVLRAIETDLRNTDEADGCISTLEGAARHAANHLRASHERVVFDGKSFYAYNDPGSDGGGFFAKVPDLEMKSFLIDHFAGKPVVDRESKRNEVTKRLEAEFLEERFFDSASVGVNLSNGFLRWDAEAAEPVFGGHSPEHRALHRLEFPYDPAAEAPVFLAGVRRIFGGDERRVAAFQEFLANAVLQLGGLKDNARNALLLYGGANTGKSTLLHLVKSLFPPSAVQSLPPNTWGQDYKRTLLFGCAINVVTELGGGRVISGAHFKKIVSLEETEVRQIWRKPFTFVPRARHLFATNNLPTTDDKTEAFGRRLMAFRMAAPLAGDEIDGGFLDRVKGERPGVLNWAIEGARRVQREGEYTLPTEHEELVVEMQFPGDPVEPFVRFGVEKDPNGGRLTNVRLRAAMRDYSEARGVDTSEWWRGVKKNIHLRKLGMRVQELHRAERHVLHGKPFYLNVRLRDDLGLAVDDAIEHDDDDVGSAKTAHRSPSGGLRKSIDARKVPPPLPQTSTTTGHEDGGSGSEKPLPKPTSSGSGRRLGPRREPPPLPPESTTAGRDDGDVGSAQPAPKPANSGSGRRPGPRRKPPPLPPASTTARHGDSGHGFEKLASEPAHRAPRRSLARRRGPGSGPAVAGSSTVSQDLDPAI